MGQKGDKHSNDAALSSELVLEKLASLENITSKKMFGGHGIFSNGKMFGMVDSKGQVYMKADPEEIGLGTSEKHGKMPYFKIDIENLNVEQWEEWALKSIALH